MGDGADSWPCQEPTEEEEEGIETCPREGPHSKAAGELGELGLGSVRPREGAGPGAGKP